MRKLLLTAVAAGSLAAAAAPGMAAPSPVDTGRMAGTRVTTALPGGDTLSLEIRAAELSAGPYLLVYTMRCDEGACASRQYAADLAANALSIDDSAAQARLSVPLDGRLLVVTWRPDGAVGPGAAYGSTDESDGTGSQYLGSPAVTSVQYDGHTCAGSGGVGQGTVVDATPVTGDEGAAPLSRLNLPDGAVLRC
jgi:hypothetical protein